MKDQPQNNASSQFLKTDGGKTKSNAIEVPSISLPKGGGAIKGIDEKFSVQSVTGLAIGTVFTFLGADVSPKWLLGAKVEAPEYIGHFRGFSPWSGDYGPSWFPSLGARIRTYLAEPGTWAALFTYHRHS